MITYVIYLALGVAAIVASILAVALLFEMISKTKLATVIRAKRVKKVKKERRIEDMSKEKGEGVTFNDIFMFMIAVPLVLLWVGFAGFVIHSGLQDDSVLEQIEGYTTLIAILGGPALLIIKDALDVWKQEQAEKTAFYKTKAQAVIDYNDSMQKQAQMIEAKQQEHEHKQEK